MREEGATRSVTEATLLKLDTYSHFLHNFREVLLGRYRYCFMLKDYATA